MRCRHSCCHRPVICDPGFAQRNHPGPAVRQSGRGVHGRPRPDTDATAIPDWSPIWKAPSSTHQLRHHDYRNWFRSAINMDRGVTCDAFLRDVGTLQHRVERDAAGHYLLAYHHGTAGATRETLRRDGISGHHRRPADSRAGHGAKCADARECRAGQKGRADRRKCSRRLRYARKPRRHCAKCKRSRRSAS
jgi:hypothetical protein